MTPVIEEYRDAVRDGASVEGVRNPRKRQGSVHAIGVLAPYRALAKAFLTFNGHLLHGTTPSRRHRTLMMLRVARLRRCAHECPRHVPPAADARITDAEIARALLSAVDELLADAGIGDATWHEPAQEFDERQPTDIVSSVGTDELVAMTFRSFRGEPEAELLAQLPQAGKPPG